ncbi:DUF2732 family protein [Edwardsiella tarda]|uniref:DUF2732 family protein n=1 Tax=Edwardsiella tarda TaxID=636 RepID=UPI0030820CCC|nr:DUF2732 family protein [Edwardsiella tarda]
MLRQGRKAKNTSDEQLVQLFSQARQEGERHAVDKCAVRLTALVCEARQQGLCAAEVIDLLQQEIASLDSKGGAAWN